MKSSLALRRDGGYPDVMGACPTGGKDKGDGSFCEACGVYSHVRRPAALRRDDGSLEIRLDASTVIVVSKFLMLGFVGYALVTTLLAKAARLEERAALQNRVLLPTPTFGNIKAPPQSSWNDAAFQATLKKMAERPYVPPTFTPPISYVPPPTPPMSSAQPQAPPPPPRNTVLFVTNSRRR